MPRFKKGSKEAKAWGRRMKAARKRKFPEPRKRTHRSVRHAIRNAIRETRKAVTHPVKYVRRRRRKHVKRIERVKKSMNFAPAATLAIILGAGLGTFGIRVAAAQTGSGNGTTTTSSGNGTTTTSSGNGTTTTSSGNQTVTSGSITELTAYANSVLSNSGITAYAQTQPPFGIAWASVQAVIGNWASGQISTYFNAEEQIYDILTSFAASTNNVASAPLAPNTGTSGVQPPPGPPPTPVPVQTVSTTTYDVIVIQPNGFQQDTGAMVFPPGIAYVGPGNYASSSCGFDGTHVYWDAGVPGILGIQRQRRQPFRLQREKGDRGTVRNLYILIR